MKWIYLTLVLFSFFMFGVSIVLRQWTGMLGFAIAYLLASQKVIIMFGLLPEPPKE